MIRKACAAIIAAIACVVPAVAGASVQPGSSVIGWDGQPLCLSAPQLHAGEAVTLVPCAPRLRWEVGALGIHDNSIRVRGTDLYLASEGEKVVLKDGSGPLWHYGAHTLQLDTPHGREWLTRCPGDSLSPAVLRQTAPLNCRTWYVFTAAAS